jgi:hypothetical protein
MIHGDIRERREKADRKESTREKRTNTTYHLVPARLTRCHRLTSLSKEITLLTKLVYLDVSENNISQLPESFVNLQALEYLDLRNNKIKKLPSSLGGLPNLRQLLVVGNPITSIPKEVLEVNPLSLSLSLSLALHMCAVSPYLLAGDDWLVAPTPLYLASPLLMLESSPTSHTRQAEGRTEELKTYLREVENSQKCYRMKLMLVGKENVGKTSLLRALTRTNGSSTRGRVAAAKVPIAQTLSTPAAYYALSLSLSLLRYSHIYSFAYHGVVRREVPRRSLAANVAFSGSAVFRVDSAVYSA